MFTDASVCHLQKNIPSFLRLEICNHLSTGIMIPLNDILILFLNVFMWFFFTDTQAKLTCYYQDQVQTIFTVLD